MSEEDDESGRRRRLVLLLLVGIVVVLGAGIGAFTLFDDDDLLSDGTDLGALELPGSGPDDGSGVADGGAVADTDGDGPTDGDTGSDGDSGGDGDDDSEDGDTGGGDDDDSGGGDDGDDGSDEEIDVSLDTDGEGTLLAAAGVVPGDNGTETITLSNTGDRGGWVRLAATNITDLENGIVGPEDEVDDTPDEGELSDAVEIRITFEYPDGTEKAVVGSASTYVALADVTESERPDTMLGPGEDLTVTLDWRLDQSTGNEIQSDGTVFDAVFQLQTPEN